MATYRISGVWKNSEGVITHYAVHTVSNGSATRARKITKVQAILLVEGAGNIVTTYIWNYTTARFNVGTTVHVVNSLKDKYLRTNHDNTLRDNLDNLIDYDWIL